VPAVWVLVNPELLKSLDKGALTNLSGENVWGGGGQDEESSKSVVSVTERNQNEEPREVPGFNIESDGAEHQTHGNIPLKCCCFGQTNKDTHKGLRSKERFASTIALDALMEHYF